MPVHSSNAPKVFEEAITVELLYPMLLSELFEEGRFRKEEKG